LSCQGLYYQQYPRLICKKRLALPEHRMKENTKIMFLIGDNFSQECQH
jgi:hypothetical protein